MSPFHAAAGATLSGGSVSSISHDFDTTMDLNETMDSRDPSSPTMSSPLLSHDGACLDINPNPNPHRLETWRHEILAIEASLEARDTKRAQISQKIVRLRQTMDKACLEAGAPNFPGTAPIDGTNQNKTTRSQHQATEWRDTDHSGRSSARALLRRSLLEKENAVNRCIQSARLCGTSAGADQPKVDELLATVKEKKLIIEEMRSGMQRLLRDLEICKRKAGEDLLKQRTQTMNQIEYLERKNEAQQDFLNFQTRTAQSEIDSLKESLEASQRRVVELEVEIQTSSLCQQAQANKGHAVDAFDSSTSDSSTSTSSTDSVVESDNERSLLMETIEKFKRERVETTMQAQKLKQQNDFLAIKCQSLQRHLDAYRKELNGNDSVDDPEDDDSFVEASPQSEKGRSVDPVSMLQPSLDGLRKRLEILELQNLESAKRSRELKAKMESDALEAREVSEANERTISLLRKENKDLRVKVSSFDAYASHPSSKAEVPTERSSRFDYLERKLDANATEIIRLEDQLNLKDRVISLLRSQIVELRVTTDKKEKQVPLGDSLGPADQDLSTEPSDASYISELEEELNEARRTLREQGKAIAMLSKKLLVDVKSRMKSKRAPAPVRDNRYMYFV